MRKVLVFIGLGCFWGVVACGGETCPDPNDVDAGHVDGAIDGARDGTADGALLDGQVDGAADGGDGGWAETDETWAGVFGPAEVDYDDMPADLGATFIRRIVLWRNVEPQEDQYLWEGADIAAMDRFAAAGGKIVPTIKTTGGKWEFWAVESPLDATQIAEVAHDCSWMPKDMQTEFDWHYGYSETYYDFISQVLWRYRGSLDVIVIENEENGDGFWCSTGEYDHDMAGMAGYVKMLVTAKKAIQDVAPEVKLANGGLVGLQNTITHAYLENGQDAEAVAFWEGCMDNAQGGAGSHTADDLRNYLQQPHPAARLLRTAYLLEHLPSVVDYLNIHYKEVADYYPEVVAFVKAQTGGAVPVMNNELGVKWKPTDPFEARYQEAAKVTVKYFVYSYLHNARPMIWYTRDHGEYSAVGIYDEQGIHEEWETYAALQACYRFLNRTFLQVQDVSDEDFRRYVFLAPDERIEVIWQKPASPSSLEIPAGVEAYDYLGQPISGDTLTTFPAYFVADSGNAP
jgi:hypothetical protein